MAGGFSWRGAEVLVKVEAASVFAVDRVMAECVQHAKNHHPWQDRTGTLNAGIQITENAHPAGTGVAGVWGVAAVLYAIFLELGTSRMPPYPFLLPAADLFYPLLRAYIREAIAA